MIFKNSIIRLATLFGFLSATLHQGQGKAADPMQVYPLLTPNMQVPFFGSAQPVFGAPLARPRWSFTLSSLALDRFTATSSRSQDFENYRVGYQNSVPCGLNWRCDVSLGVDYQSRGFLDNFINRYHNLISAPQGDRPYLPNNEHKFQVMGQGVTIASQNSQSVSLAPVVFRLVRPMGQGELVAGLSLPLMPKRLSVTGHSPGLSLGYQWRNLHRRISLVGVGVGGGIPVSAAVSPRWHLHGQITLAPPTLFGRRQLVTLLVQDRPVKGYKAEQFNDLGSMLIYEIEVKPGGKSRFKLVEDLENGQDFTLGLTW